MEYLGVAAPFYISRFRLRLLNERISGGASKITGVIQVPGLGHIQIDHNRMDSGSMAQLENVITWLSANDGIGDAIETDCQYTWIALEASSAWVSEPAQGIDHLVMADPNANIPKGWSCLLVGGRANLTSLVNPTVPALGSSPLAMQTALRMVKDSPDVSVARDVRDREGNCNEIRNAIHALAADPGAAAWSVAGVVEVVRKCAEEQILLGAPLFLAYF